MQYFPFGPISEIAPGTMKLVTLGGAKILLANTGDNFYAVEDKCPHMGASLCAGTLSGSTVTCPKHGAKFDVTNGEPIGPAKILFLKLKTKGAKTYPVKIENNQILVGL